MELAKRRAKADAAKTLASSVWPVECANGVLLPGQSVETRFQVSEGGDGRWYAGVVTDAQGDPRAATVSVRYDDGDRFEGPASVVYIRPRPLDLDPWVGRIFKFVVHDGCMLVLCMVVFVVYLFAVLPFRSGALPTGEIGMWYQLPLCKAKRDASGPGYVLQPQAALTPLAGGVCERTCAHSADGACDDGGPGATYGLCSLGTDCADCGARQTQLPGFSCPANPAASASPATIQMEPLDGFALGRRYAPAFLLESGTAALLTVAISDALGAPLLPQLTLQLGPTNQFPWADASRRRLAQGEGEGEGAAEERGQGAEGGEGVEGGKGAEGGDGTEEGGGSAAARHLPSRRPLKGGGSGGYGSQLSGGRSRTYGAGRWGRASGGLATTTARVPPTMVTRGGGGGGVAPYDARRGGYYYGPAAIPSGSRFVVVPPTGYACFACAYTATRLSFHSVHGRSCDGSRYDCGQTSSFRADSSLDRYELSEALFDAPKDRSRWPLTLRVTQLDLYTLGSAGGGDGGGALGGGGLGVAAPAGGGGGVPAASGRRLSQGLLDAPPGKTALLSFSTDDGSSSRYVYDLAWRLLSWATCAVVLLPFLLSTAAGATSAIVNWLARRWSRQCMRLCCFRRRLPRDPTAKSESSLL